MMHNKQPYFTLNPFKMLLWVLQSLFNGGDENTPTSSDDSSSALTQERAKTVDEK